MNEIDSPPDCLYYKDKFALPKAFTFCYRWNAYQYTTREKIQFLITMGVIHPEFKELEEGIVFGYWKTGPWFGIKLKNKEYTWFGHPDTVWDIQKWTHVCFSYNMISGSLTLVENGEVIYVKNISSIIRLGELLNPNFNFLSVGCAYRKNVYKYASIHGRVTDVHAWDTEVGNKILKDITSCRDVDKQGNIFNWNNTNWTFVTPRNLSELEHINFDEVCISSFKASLIFLPYLSTFNYALRVSCGKFSGILASYRTKKDFVDIQNFIGKKKYLNNKQCMLEDPHTIYEMVTWIGLKKRKSEENFTDVVSHKQPEYVPWQKDRILNNGEVYNCLVLYLKAFVYKGQPSNITKASVKDELCSEKRCSICEIPTTPAVVQVRGLCQDSDYDTSYVYSISEDGRSMYVGFYSSAIWYDYEKKQWVWIDRKDSNAVATSNSRLDSLFLGINKVNFENTSEICVNDKSNKVVQIKMTSCIKKNQFTCDDGTCISMDQRCDQFANCLDGSDEINCKQVEMSSNYNKKIPPFNYDEKEKKTYPVKVHLIITILDILKITEIDHLCTLKFLTHVQWYDHRLKFRNLKVSKSANALNFEEVEKLWIPYLIFGNTPNAEGIMPTSQSEVTITRNGSYTVSKPDMVEEIHIFDGKDNKLTFLTVYTNDFKCKFQLEMYPFDTQTCTAVGVIRKLEEKYLVFIPKRIKMYGEVLLPQYHVTSWKLMYRNMSRPSSGILVTITLKRRIVNELLTSYLPTTIILVIVYCTNYFKMSHFNTALTINLTSMLVLTTLFIGITNSLPRVAYIKVIQYVSLIISVFSVLVFYSQNHTH